MISITQLIIFLLVLILLFGDVKKIIRSIQEFFNQSKNSDKKD